MHGNSIGVRMFSVQGVNYVLMNRAHAFLPLHKRHAVPNASDPWKYRYLKEIHLWKGYLIMPAMNALSLGLDTQNLPGLYLPPTTLSSRYYRPLQIVPKETHRQYASFEAPSAKMKINVTLDSASPVYA